MDKQLTSKLWEAADNLRANSSLKSQEYSTPVLGLIFLKYADNKFLTAKEKMEHSSSTRRTIGAADYKAEGVLYLPEKAQYSFLINLSEDEVVGQHINNAMSLIEEHNEDLKGVLPKSYNKMNDVLLADLLRTFNSIPTDSSTDYFGRIYEYFLGKFAMTEGQGGGEFYTPESLVKLIVNIIEPFEGKIYDPACGSGGMFVQSAKFIEDHQKNASNAISIYGQERVDETLRLAKMNMAVHGLSADIKSGNTYYEDLHNCVGKFDFVMANPPFNVDGIKKDRLNDDPRYPFGMPKNDNGNYLWIQNFYTALNEKGRAGFIISNSASDAKQSEKEIRKKIIKTGHVDVIITTSTNFFYTVTLPVSIWFFDKNKVSDLLDKVLFINAKEIYNQVDRRHRDFKPEQLEFLTNIVRLYRGNKVENTLGSKDLMDKHFSDGYIDVKGLCKVADISEIEAQDWSLNPGRYVGVEDEEDDGLVFNDRLSELNNKLKGLNEKAGELERKIQNNIKEILRN